MANIRPSGDRYLMEDFYYAGGLPALLQRIRPHLQCDALTVNGRTLGDNIAGAQVFDDDVIRPLDKPIYAEGALAVLRGNLAPDGVVIKPSACAPHLLRHTGRAAGVRRLPGAEEGGGRPRPGRHRRRRAGAAQCRPAGRPGMPEWGMLPIPTKLLKQGVSDMLRLSDARMSGTSYGGCLLHCAPEALCRRPAGAGAHRRPHHGGRAGAAHPPGGGATPSWRAAAPPGCRRPSATSAATAGCSRATSCRPTRAATSTSSKPASAPRCPSPISTD
jgi:hypothetical protein